MAAISITLHDNKYWVEADSVCNHTSDNKIGQPRSGSPSMITDRIGWHEVLLPINKSYNFREKNSQIMKERENVH